MNRGIQWALVLISVAVLFLSGLSYQAVQQIRESRERAVCITEQTGPFFGHVSAALVELNDDGTLTAETATALRDDAATLDQLNERCP